MYINNLHKRYCYDDQFDNEYCDGWSTWGRWVLFGCIIGGGLIIFFLLSCLSARRRRKHGQVPFRGTGWTLGVTPAGHNAPMYNPNYRPQQENNYAAPPPAYGNQNNSGYYGPGMESGVTAPPAAHTSEQYKAPDGPPPGRY